MSLTYAELKTAVAALTYRHPTADTNITEVVNDGTDIAFLTDESELAEQLKEANEQIAELEKDVSKLEDEARENAAQYDEGQRLLDEVKDDAGTLRSYRDRAEAAEKRATDWSEAHEAMSRELTALRKRKGVESNVVRHAGEVARWVAYVSRAKPQDFAHFTHCVKEAGELRAKLYAP